MLFLIATFVCMLMLYRYHFCQFYFYFSLIFCLVGAKNFRTQTKDSTLNPVWNEVFEVLYLLIFTQAADYCKLLHHGLASKYEIYCMNVVVLFLICTGFC